MNRPTGPSEIAERNLRDQAPNTLDTALAARRPALISYFPLGDPEARYADPALYVECGVDVLEVGVPAAGPGLDGPVVQNSMRRALASGTTAHTAVQSIAGMRERFPGTASVWMTYPTADRSDFRELVRSSGADAVLVAGAQPFSYDDIDGVHEIQFLPHEPSKEQVQAATRATGYVMVAADHGVSGLRDRVSTDNAVLLGRLRAAGVTAPLALGFGIADENGAREAVECGADAVIVGTATLLAGIESTHALRKLLEGLRDALDR